MDAKLLPWQDLQTFLATARAGSLVAAAGELQTSAATVMRRLRALEKAMGVSLFMRSPRGYGLTAAGRELLEYVASMEDRVIAARRSLEGRDQRLTGTIRIATLDDLMHVVLGPIFAAFARRHPGVELDISIGIEHSDLRRHSADVALRAGAQPDSPDVIARKVTDIAVALYASREYLRLHGPVLPGSLAGHRVVRADEGRRQLAMEQALDQLGCSDIGVRSNSMLARVAAVRHGLGPGLLPCFSGDSDPELVRIGEVLPQAAAALWLVVHADMRSNARVRAFSDHLYRELVSQRALFVGERGRASNDQ
jgi:DNA-binding transcriptional LysR family regulator